jgi:hypothetical protein
LLHYNECKKRNWTSTTSSPNIKDTPTPPIKIVDTYSLQESLKLRNSSISTKLIRLINNKIYSQKYSNFHKLHTILKEISSWANPKSNSFFWVSRMNSDNRKDRSHSTAMSFLNRFIRIFREIMRSLSGKFWNYSIGLFTKTKKI